MDYWDIAKHQKYPTQINPGVMPTLKSLDPIPRDCWIDVHGRHRCHKRRPGDPQMAYLVDSPAAAGDGRQRVPRMGLA